MDKNNISSVFDVFDVIVVGGGHAGIEAAHSAAKMGSNTLLITLEIEKIGLMSCNPAIGGVGKGHIVYEISALGGLMPKLCSKTYLQARMLNTKKGPAVQGLRLQIDKYAYNKLSCKILKNTPNLTLFEGMAQELLLDENNKITGIKTDCENIFKASCVILTTGTFLNGVIHIGKENHKAGRIGEQSVAKLTNSLTNAGLKVGRLKTGTPPRLLKSSIDWSKMQKQKAADLHYLFELTPHPVKNTHHCYITRTTAQTHEIIRENLKLSAMYSGNITGIGPRYCPSIEDKIARFPDKTGHTIFVEPEGDHPNGANSDEIYPNGISTSLPYEIQEKYIASIPGFENAVITKAGYAIEYDFVYPEQLKHTLETKAVNGLFLAGQINGTTGYEEAAAQGLIAGINAHLKTTNQKPFILEREESYIGVMIDDLVTMGVDEPYRMFTSRAERRLLLRQDNVFLRLTDKGYKLGLINPELYKKFEKERQELAQALKILKETHSHKKLLELFEVNTENPKTKNHKEIIKKITGLELSERNV
ncbi:tRNA uridine-5-carboxymethylaminomethyl(34) synthesis enzyme MnmG, partial [Candidatus Dependentiae bacterium]